MLLINSIEELDNMRSDLAGVYKLARSLDFNDDASYDNPANKPTYTTGAGWNPIDNFEGSFDGDNYTISNLFINRPAKQGVGLFGSATASAIFSNFSLLDVDIVGYEGVGSLCGMNVGTTTNVHVTGSITGEDYTGGLLGASQNGDITQCSAIVQVIGNNYVGGLIGLNIGAFIHKSFTKGIVTGSFYVGGLIGTHFTTNIDNCYSHAETNGVYIVGGLSAEANDAPCVVHNCYSTGKVTGMMLFGGLMGINNGLDDHCFWDIETSEQSTSAAGIGKTTSEMTNITIFQTAFWDIANEDTWTNEIWIIGDSYPYFGWEYTPPIPEVAKNLESISQNKNMLDIEKLNSLESIEKNNQDLTSSEEQGITSIKKQVSKLSSTINNIKKSLEKNITKLKSEYEEL